MSLPKRPVSELTKKIMDIVKGGGSQLEFYLSTIDAETVSKLIEEVSPTFEDGGEYKIYTYNNPWRNKIVLKTEFWTKWIDNNPTFVGLFLEADGVTPALPSFGGVKPPTWDISKGPKDSDWQAFFAKVQLEITKVQEKNKDLSNQLDVFKEREKLKGEIHQDAIKFKNERITELEKGLVEEQKKLFEIGKLLVSKEGEMTKEAAAWEKATKNLRDNLQKETQARAEAEFDLRQERDQYTIYRNQKDVEVLEKSKEIEQLKKTLKDKGDESGSIIVDNSETVAKLKKSFEEVKEKLNQEIKKEKQKWNYLEKEATNFISRIRGDYEALSGLKQMKEDLSRMETVFKFVNLPRTWDFVKEPYDQIIEVKEELLDEATDKVDEENAIKAGRFKVIKENLISFLEEVRNSIPSEHWEKQTSFRLAIDALGNDSKTSAERFLNIRPFLQSRPNLLVKREDILAWFNLWEDLEGASRTISKWVDTDKLYWEIITDSSSHDTSPISPDKIKPDSIHSGLSTPSVINVIDDHAFSSDLTTYLIYLESELDDYVGFSFFEDGSKRLPFSWKDVRNRLRDWGKENWTKKLKQLINKFIKEKEEGLIIYSDERMSEVMGELTSILTDSDLDIILDKTWLTASNIKYILENIIINIPLTKDDWIEKINDLRREKKVVSKDLSEGVDWENKLKSKFGQELEDYAKGILRDIYQKKREQIPDYLKDEIALSPKDKLVQWKGEVSDKFTEELVEKWEGLGIDKEKAKIWLGNISSFPATYGLVVFGKKTNDDRLAPFDVDFVDWLIKVKSQKEPKSENSKYADPQWYRSQFSNPLGNLYKEWNLEKPKSIAFTPHYLSASDPNISFLDSASKMWIYDTSVSATIGKDGGRLNEMSFIPTKDCFFEGKEVKEGIIVIRSKDKNLKGWDNTKQLIKSDAKLELKTTKIIWGWKEEGHIEHTGDENVIHLPGSITLLQNSYLLVFEDFKIIGERENIDEPIRKNLTKENIEFILNNLEV